MFKRSMIALGCSALLLSSAAMAKDAAVTVDLLTDSGSTPIGTVELSDSAYGLVLTPHLKALTPGVHGFHIHQNGSCGPSTKNGKTVLGGAAGGHFDPDNTGKHGYPWEDGTHKGDLPPLFVTEDGMATTPMLAPKLKVADVIGHALMIHAGGDNFSDTPKPLGGGGARMACGVIE